MHGSHLECHLKVIRILNRNSRLKGRLRLAGFMKKALFYKLQTSDGLLILNIK